MKTADDVLKFVDEQIADSKLKATETCVDAFVEEYDRDTFREAMNAGAKLRALQRLRSEIALRIEVAAPARPGRRRTPAASR